MRGLASKHLCVLLGTVVLMACVCSIARAQGKQEKQDKPAVLQAHKDAKPNFGAATLKDGFQPVPFRKNVIAGGGLRETVRGVAAWVDENPDFILDYTAGKAPLSIYVESRADTTLLVYTPDGEWVADDDSGGNLNPLLTFDEPKTGRYQIWVGTYGKDLGAAILCISSQPGDKANVVTPKQLLKSLSNERVKSLLLEWKIDFKQDDDGTFFRCKDRDGEFLLTPIEGGEVLLVSTRIAADATLEQVNRWNDKRVLSRAVFKQDPEGKRPSRLEADLDCTLGVTPEGVRRFIDRFKESRRDYEDFLKSKRL